MWLGNSNHNYQSFEKLNTKCWRKESDQKSCLCVWSQWHWEHQSPCSLIRACSAISCLFFLFSPETTLPVYGIRLKLFFNQTVIACITLEILLYSKVFKKYLCWTKNHHSSCFARERLNRLLTGNWELHVYLVKLLGNNSGIFQCIKLAGFSVHSRGTIYSLQMIGEFLKTELYLHKQEVLFLQLWNVVALFCIGKGNFIPNELYSL